MRYMIPEVNMETLQKKLKTIENKCNKYGCEFKFEILGEEYIDQFDDFRQYTGAIKFFDVNVSGVAVINNWEFVATIEHTPNGNIVRVFNEQDVPDWVYTVEPKCDHCNTKHNRKNTYLIRNTETEEFKQVGKSCLKDFTNGLSAEMVTDYMSWFKSIEKHQEGLHLSSSTRYLPVKSYLLYVAETINHFGYVSKGTAMERNDMASATANRALRYMCYQGEQERKEMEEVGFNSDTKANENLVEDALAWIATQPMEELGYIHNLKVACSLEYCEHRDLGIIASLLPAHFRALEKEAARLAREAAKALNANKPESNWVGEIGQRIEISAECKFLCGWETDFGYTQMYKFTDEAGNIYVWKTGKGIENGPVTLKGTIKAHTEFRGEKQTELTRCKVL